MKSAAETAREAVGMDAARQYAYRKGYPLLDHNTYLLRRDAFMAGAAWAMEQAKLATQAALAGTDHERRATDRDKND